MNTVRIIRTKIVSTARWRAPALTSMRTGVRGRPGEPGETSPSAVFLDGVEARVDFVPLPGYPDLYSLTVTPL